MTTYPAAAGVGGKMKIPKNAIWFLLAAAFSLLFAFSCGFEDGSDDDDDDAAPDQDDDTVEDDDDNDDDDDTVEDNCDEATHDPLIVQGKDRLSAIDPDSAYEHFADALEACPPSADARTGMLISDAQWLVKWLQAMLDQAKGPGTDLQEQFEQELLPKSAEMFALADDLIANHPKMRFFIDPLPLWITDDHIVLEMSGEWDIFDVANAKVFARAWEGAGRFLLAADLEYDEQLFEDNPAPADATTEEEIHHYCGLLLQMFGDPNWDGFLTLVPGGEENLVQAGVNFGLALLEMKTNFYATRDEIDLQEDDIAGYVDANGNGVWDEGETFRVPYFGALTQEMNLMFIDLLDLAEALGVAFLDRGPEDLHPMWPDWFLLSELNVILKYFDVLDPANPIRLPPIPVQIGRRFYQADEGDLRNAAEWIVQFLFDATAP